MAYLNLQKLCLLLLSHWRWELHQVNLEWMWGSWFLCYNILKEDASLPRYSLGNTSHWKVKILFFHTILCLLPDFHPLSTQWITCVFSIIVIEWGEEWVWKDGQWNLALLMFHGFLGLKPVEILWNMKRAPFQCYRHNLLPSHLWCVPRSPWPILCELCCVSLSSLPIIWDPQTCP